MATTQKKPSSVYLKDVEKAMTEEKGMAPTPPVPPAIQVQHEPLTEAACRIVEVALRITDVLYHAEEEGEEDAEYTLATLRGMLRQAGYPKQYGVGNDIAHAKAFVVISRKFRQTTPLNLANFYTAWGNFVKNYREFQKERERWLTDTNQKWVEWQQQKAREEARKVSGILGS